MPDKINKNKQIRQSRPITVKIRLSVSEAQLIDARRNASSIDTRAGFMRNAALESDTSGPLAELIGSIGIHLNRLDAAPAATLQSIGYQLDQIILLMQRNTHGQP